MSESVFTTLHDKGESSIDRLERLFNFLDWGHWRRGGREKVGRMIGSDDWIEERVNDPEETGKGKLGGIVKMYQGAINKSK